MARRATIAKLLEGGPFVCRMVNPDLDVRVLELVEGGARAEVEVFGKKIVALVKVGGLRCTLPKRQSFIAAWVEDQLDQGDKTYEQLFDLARHHDETAMAVAPMLATMSRWGRIGSVGEVEVKEAGKRPKRYRIWSLRKKVEA